MVSLHFSARRALAFLLLCIAVPAGAGIGFKPRVDRIEALAVRKELLGE